MSLSSHGQIEITKRVICLQKLLQGDSAVLGKCKQIRKPQTVKLPLYHVPPEADSVTSIRHTHSNPQILVMQS